MSTFQKKYGIALQADYNELAKSFIDSSEFFHFSNHWQQGNKATARSIVQEWLEDQPNISGGQATTKRFIDTLKILLGL